jgi:hypothetical protein
LNSNAFTRVKRRAFILKKRIIQKLSGLNLEKILLDDRKLEPDTSTWTTTKGELITPWPRDRFRGFWRSNPSIGSGKNVLEWFI